MRSARKMGERNDGEKLRTEAFIDFIVVIKEDLV